MGISINFALLMAGAAFAWQTTLHRSSATPGLRHCVKHFQQVGGQRCRGYISFDAKFTGFAGRMNVYNTQLFIVAPAGKLAAAIKKQHITLQYHEQIKAKAYRIPRFTLYMEGYAVIGGSEQFMKYARAPFKLQLSDALGDYTTPEFGNLDSDIYSGENAWEVSGAIADTKLSPLKIAEIYFKDYNIRIK